MRTLGFFLLGGFLFLSAELAFWRAKAWFYRGLVLRTAKACLVWEHETGVLPLDVRFGWFVCTVTVPLCADPRQFGRASEALAASVDGVWGVRVRKQFSKGA